MHRICGRFAYHCMSRFNQPLRPRPPVHPRIAFMTMAISLFRKYDLNLFMNILMQHQWSIWHSRVRFFGSPRKWKYLYQNQSIEPRWFDSIHGYCDLRVKKRDEHAQHWRPPNATTQLFVFYFAISVLVQLCIRNSSQRRKKPSEESNQSEIDTTKINLATVYGREPPTEMSRASCTYYRPRARTHKITRKKMFAELSVRRAAGLLGCTLHAYTNPQRRNDGTFKYFNLIRIWCNLFYFISFDGNGAVVRNCVLI